MRNRGLAAWWILRSSALGLALIGGVGCAAETEGSNNTEAVRGTPSAIFGGEGDDDQVAIRGVVALKVASDTGTFELCSGALVAPNVVLTARHCVASSMSTAVACDAKGHSTNGRHVSGDRDPASVGIYTGSAPKFREKPEAVGTAIVAPKGDYLCDSDIALVILSDAITSVAPLAVRLDARVSAGETIRSVGYGQNDQRIPIGTRLRRDGVAVLAMGSGVSESNTALGPHEFEVGRSICQGDSGGPAISEATGAVIGVVSRGGECNDDFGHIYTTTAGWKPLFDEAFTQAGGAPIVESGEPSVNESAPRTKATVSPVEEQPASADSCSTARAPARTGAHTSGLGLAALLACALVRRARSKQAREREQSG